METLISSQTVSNCLGPTLITGLGIAKDICISITAILGTCIGWKGLNTWRYQLYGKVEYDIIKSVLKACISLRNSVNWMRAPFQQIPGPDEPLPIGSEDKERIKRTIKVYEAHWERCWESMSELETAAIDAEIHWGQKVPVLMRPIRSVFNDLQMTSREFLELKQNSGSIDPKYSMQVKSRFFANPNGTDEISANLSNSISALEQYMRTLKVSHLGLPDKS